MKIFRETQKLPISPEEAWEFFSTPRNLEELTPPSMRFEIVDLDEEEMREGQIIVCRIRLAPLIWTNWVTEIRTVEPGRKFVDDQRLGPYALWHHTHEFKPTDDGGVEMSDTIRYAVGWGPIGWIAHRIHVDRTVRKIFEFRREKLEKLFVR
ncbi:MAG: ligand-binding SRPBCC domain-containing protein [Verrucomicrobiales bacterium]|jgi:ligand-binding SRPBCC domain-containing protein